MLGVLFLHGWFMLEKLLKNTAAYCEAEGLVAPGDGVLVACSGGPDSLALLDIFARLSGLAAYDFRVEVAHFEHGIRQDGSSREDASFVEAFCRERQLPCHLEHEDVPAWAASKGLSMETAARNRRYAFLERVREARRLTSIATAHQADDQAETVLMRILRGTGTEGLAAMRPRARGRLPLIRPLLFATRAEIEEYCRQRGLSPRRDKTNGEPACTRNRLRLETIPQLKQEYNPQLVRALCQLAAISAEETDYLEEQADEVWPLVMAGDCLKAEALRSLPAVLQRIVLRRLWQQETGSSQDLPYAHVERLRQMLFNGHSGSQQQLPHGYVMRLHREGKMLLANIVREE